MYLIILTFIATMSVLVNCFLLYRCQKLRIQIKQPQLSKDATQLMQDLMSGGCITVTQIIDPRSILLMSPRDYNA